MKLSVRTYLIIAFVLVSAMPLAVFWSWPYSRILQAEKIEAHERHLLIAQSLASALQRYHRDLVAALSAFRQSIAAGQALEAKALFTNLRFRHICVADASSGDVLSSYLAETIACPERIPPDRLALFQRLAADGSVGVSRVFAPDGEEPRLYLATQTGQNLIVGAIHADFFEEIRRQVKFGRDGHAAIVDHTGRLLAHPVDDWAKRAVDFSEVPPVRRVLDGENGVQTFYSPAKQQEMISGFAPVQGIGWGVIVPQPLSELEEAAAEFNWNALLVLALGLVFSSAMALAISVQFSRRLGHIATAVHEVARENDQALVPVSHDVVRVRELLALEEYVNRLASESAAARDAKDAHNRKLEEANCRLIRERDERQLAEQGRKRSEIRFRSLFANAPIPIREEDLSGMKRLIDALEISEPQEFSAFLDSHPEFLEACGKSIEVVDANEASVALHGYQDKQALLSRVVQTLSPAAMKIVRMTVEAIHRGETGRAYETQITRTDGTKRTVSATWSVIPGHEATYGRILLTSVDLTERLESEEALRQAQKMEAVGQLTGGVAHDFNNLLTVIGGNIELMELNPDVDRELTAPILKAVQRGSELTHRLLAFSREQPLMPRPIDLSALVDGMTELLRRSLGEEIAIDIRNEQDQIFALADPGQVEAALLNLVLNSRDAMPDGGKLVISIRTATVGQDGASNLAAGDYAVLAVTDTGTGMSKDTRDHAFEPFFTTKEVGKGSGLGLSMVYGFARQSNGDVLIASQEGVGTEVSLYLPRVENDDTTCDATGRGTDQQTGSGERILILEDDPDVRSYLMKLIAASGYEGVPAEDAKAARACLARYGSFDVLISDVMLPGGVRGPEFATEMLREHPETPVIFITGRPTESIASQIPALNQAPIIVKPFDKETLMQAIGTSLCSRRR